MTSNRCACLSLIHNQKECKLLLITRHSSLRFADRDTPDVLLGKHPAAAICKRASVITQQSQIIVLNADI